MPFFACIIDAALGYNVICAVIFEFPERNSCLNQHASLFIRFTRFLSPVSVREREREKITAVKKKYGSLRLGKIALHERFKVPL